jgi:branched-chain amino acid transport system substrate-binding protein
MAEIVIGTSLPKTGPYAETQFLQYQRAYDQWARDVNAAGGMLGREVRLLWHDDFGQPERCEANFVKLIKEDKVDLLLGPCHSILIEPMAHVVEDAQMVLLEGSGSVSEMFRKGRKWLFLCWDADCNYMKSYLEFMTDPANPRRVSKVGTVAGNRPRGLGHAMGVNKHARDMGLEVVFDERTSGEIDYADVFKRGKASGAEAIMWDIEARGDDKKRAIQAAIDAGFSASQLWLSESPGQKVETGVFSRVTWLPMDPRPQSQKFDADFRAMWNAEPEYHSAGGYACGQVLHQAVEATGSLDNAKIREAILSMTFDTVMGQLRYGEDGLPIASFPVAQWQDGTPQLVYPKEAKTKDAIFV